jgi:LPS O-antigen subunit length determinant protein (WzzB/FepE family)
MENNSNLNTKNISDDEIDLRELLQVVWSGKWLMFTIITVFFILASLYSITLPNIYQSKAVLSPAGEQNAMNGAMRGYGSLAGLAGIALPTQNNASNSIKAIEKLKSLSFFQGSILPNIFLPDLMAVKSWDSVSNTISYDLELYDESTQKWVRDYNFPQTQIPSAQESFEIFIEDHLTVKENKDTGFVTISIKHQSPFIAQAWTELVVKEINNFFRLKDKTESQAAINFLNTQLSQTNFAEIREVVAQLLQENMKQLTLIEVTDYYVFGYIDPPAAMEKEHEPSRASIILLGAFCGFILGFVILIIKYFYKNE